MKAFFDQKSAALAAAVCCGFLGACASQTGPERYVKLEDDKKYLSVSLENWQLPVSAEVRNDIVTRRMYVVDVNYNEYEGRLTRELQNEGIIASTANISLSGLAAVIPVAQTSRILSQTAAGVALGDRTYQEKELLSHTMQSIQTQMRADRKAVAAVILSRMFKDGRTTDIAQYPLAMALADVDQYYRAGTVASAMIGLTKTVSNAEQNAEATMLKAGPNGTEAAQANAKANNVPANLASNTVVKTVVVTAPKNNQPPAAADPKLEPESKSNAAGSGK